MMLKEFMSISKNKPIQNLDENELEDEASFNEWNQDPNDKSRPATMRGMFNMNCQIQEYIHMAIKENVEKDL